MKKKIILRGILTVLILVVGLVLYSEKVSKIEIIDNVKNAMNEQIEVLSEKVQSIANTLSNTGEPTVVDVTGLIKGKETEHEHVYKTMYDDNKHWEECTVCGEKREEAEHSFTTTWALGYESCHWNNSYTKICICGYSETGHRPCVWDGKSYRYSYWIWTFYR